MSAALAIPAAMPVAPAYWAHQDPRGISAANGDGMRRAFAGDWSSGPIGVRAADFRAYLVGRAWVLALLDGRAGEERGGEKVGNVLLIAPSYAGTGERADAARVLGCTPLLIARAAGMPAGWEPASVTTTGGDDTGFPPLIAAAVVALSHAAIAAAVAYCAVQAAQVIDNALARDATLREVVQADAQALAVLDRHVQREVEAGAELPLDEPTKVILGQLGRRQEEYARRKTESPGGSSPAWLGAAALVAAAVAAFAIFSKK